jgi:AraC-like DNA-binding protein
LATVWLGLPADFLIGTDGRVLALKYGTDAYDQWSVDELLAIARKHAPAKRELAQEAGLSRAAFARIFNASVGEPPHSYLTRWRMGIAAQLLEETDLRLTEIAPRVGYRSEFSFSRAFKLARGVSPIQYRAAQSPS